MTRLRILLFLMFLMPLESWAEERFSGNPCNGYEECLLEFSSAFLLSKDISKVAGEAFKQNWKLLLDDANIYSMAREKARWVNCSRAQELAFIPPNSPLGKLIYETLQNRAKLSGTSERRFLFEADLLSIKVLLGEAKSDGMLMMYAGITTKEAALDILQKQKEWERMNASEVATFKEEKQKAFKQECLEDESLQMEKVRTKLLDEHRQLAKLEIDLDKIQEECAGIYNFNDVADKRYSSNEVSKGRYHRMKELGIVLCSPVDAIKNLINESNGCKQYIEDVYEIVSPECESRGANTSKGNLCNGLHRYLLKVFVNNPQYDEYLRSFVQRMNAVKTSNNKDDLLEMALESTKGDKVAAVRILALVGHDEINTTMKSLREYFIQNKQFERLVKADDLYTKEVHVFSAEDERFTGSNPIKGNMTLFKDLVRSGTTVGGHKLSGRYYHFIAGTLLACELKTKNYGDFRARSAASLAGTIYEAFDFKSHISTGVSFSDSIDNFRNDTSKHKIGGELGSTFCP